MDHPSAFDFVWNLVVGSDLSGAFWSEAVALGLLLGPWPAVLAVRLRGGDGSAGRWPLRCLLGLYLYTRLADDFALWGPIAAVVVTSAAGVTVARSAGKGVSRVEPLTEGAAGAIATALSLVLPDLMVTRVLACTILAAFVFPARPAATPVEGNRWRRWTGLAWTGLVLCVGLDGLSLRIFGPLALLAIVGWLMLGFELWRRPAAGKRRLRRCLTATSWLAITLLCLVMLLEAYFRYVYDASDANTELKTCRLWWDRHVRYNTWRYRDREFEPLDRFDDHLRVVILGDSFGFGPGINNQGDLIGARLQAALDERRPDGRPVSVFNLSCGGLTTAQELDTFEYHGKRLRPHVVVLIYMLNDINDGIVFAAINHPKLNTWRPLMDASYALEFIIWRAYQRWFMPGTSPYPRELEYSGDRRIFAAHRANIEALIAAVRQSGAAMVVAVYPFLGIPSDTGVQRRALDQVLAVFADHEVPTVDVGTVVDLTDPQHAVNPFDPHPNEKVNRTLAPVLAEMVSRVSAL